MPELNDLTDYFRAGAAAAPGAVCPHYATSDAAAGWHAGNQYRGPLNAGEILLATKGRGDRVNLYGGPSLKWMHLVAAITWDFDQEHRAGVSLERNGGTASQAIRREIERRCRPPRDQERDRQELELLVAAPIQARGRAVADANHLPLFVAANEPSLF